MGKQRAKKARESRHPARTKVIKEQLKRFEPRTDGQWDYVAAIQQYPITLAIGPAGTGKAQPLDSKILTPDGWKLMGKIQVGDLIKSPDGQSVKVQGVFPQGKREVYTIVFHDGSSTRCCGEHLWKCYYNPHLYGKKAEEYLLSTLEIKAVIEEGKNVSIPVVDPQGNDEDIDLPIDPYLLGVLLGDGHFGAHCVTFSTKDTFIKEAVEACLQKDYVVSDKTSSPYDYRIIGASTKVHSTMKGKHSNYYLAVLEGLGLKGKKSDNKFIPHLYRQASIQQKIALIQGLFDTDGTVNVNKRGGRGISFTTISRRLAEDVQEILWSLGATCSITSRKSSYTYRGKRKRGQTAYTLFTSHSLPKTLFRLPRKKDLCLDQFDNGRTDLRRRVTLVEKTSFEECQCILVDSPQHLYITDDYIVTHNTYLAIVEAIKSLSEGEVDRIVLTRPAVEAAGEKLGHLPGDEIEKIAPYMRPLIDSLETILGREATHRLIDLGVIEIIPLAFMRGMTINGFIVMDEAQNANTEQFKMLMTRLGRHSKLVVTGDLAQSDVTDIKRRVRSGLDDAAVRFAYEDDVAIVPLTLDDCQRHSLVRRIIKVYELQIPDDLNYEDMRKTRKQLDWWKNDTI